MQYKFDALQGQLFTLWHVFLHVHNTDSVPYKTDIIIPHLLHVHVHKETYCFTVGATCTGITISLVIVARSHLIRNISW